MENINAVFINEGLPQSERLIKLNQIAIQQMKIIELKKSVTLHFIKININLIKLINQKMKSLKIIIFILLCMENNIMAQVADTGEAAKNAQKSRNLEANYLLSQNADVDMFVEKLI